MYVFCPKKQKLKEAEFSAAGEKWLFQITNPTRLENFTGEVHCSDFNSTFGGFTVN